MNWGKSIALFYVLFVVAILSVVAFAFTQDVNIISDDYYQQEIAYQSQIEKLKNTEKLVEKPSVELKRNYIEVTFPKELNPKGSILFFRPSDGSKDKRVPISLGTNGIQKIDFSTEIVGLWKAKLNWYQGTEHYFQEFIIVK